MAEKRNAVEWLRGGKPLPKRGPMPPPSAIEKPLSPRPLQESDTAEVETRIRTLAAEELKKTFATLFSDAGIPLDPREIERAFTEYLNNPRVRAEARQQVEEMMRHTSQMDRDILLATLAQNAQEIESATARGEAVPPTNLLNGLVSQGADAQMQKAADGSAVRPASRGLRVGAVGRIKQGVGKSAVPVAYAVNVALAAVELFVAKEAVVGSLASVDWTQITKDTTGWVSSLLLNGLLFRQKTKVEDKFSTAPIQMFWGKTGLEKSVGLAALTAFGILVGAQFGNVKRAAVESGIAGEIAASIKTYSDKRKEIEGQLSKVDELFDSLQPEVAALTTRLLVTGGDGYGRRTWTGIRAVNGTDPENDRKYAEFAKTGAPPKAPPAEKPAKKKKKGKKAKDAPATEPTEVKKDAEGISVERSETVIQEINKKYGLEAGQGLKHLIENLHAQTQQTNPETVFTALTTLQSEAEELGNSDILDQIFGGLTHVIDTSFWNGVLFTGDRSITEVLQGSSNLTGLLRQKGFTVEQYASFADQLNKIVVTETILSYLKEISEATGVDVTMQVPSLRFDITGETVRKADVDLSQYEGIIGKSIWEHVGRPSDQEWVFIAESFKKSGLEMDVSTVWGKRMTMSYLLLFLALLMIGGAGGFIGAKKLKRRWGENGPLVADERRELHVVESTIAEDMVEYLRAQEHALVGKIATAAGTTIPSLGETDTVTYEAVLRRELRRFVLSKMIPPLHETPEGIAFIDRKSHIGSKQLRSAYVTTLNDWIERYKNNRNDLISAIAQGAQTRSRELESVLAVVTAAERYLEPFERARMVAELYRKIEQRFRDEEIDARIASIQNLYAQREALLLVREQFAIDLSKETPNVLQPADLVYVAEVAEIDASIAEHEQALKKIGGDAIDLPIGRDSSIVYTPEQRSLYIRELQDRELADRFEGGADAAPSLADTTQQYNEFVAGLRARSPQVAEALSAALNGEVTRDAIKLSYEYSKEKRGLIVSMTVHSSDGTTMKIVYPEVVPNAHTTSDEAVANAIVQWLNPAKSADVALLKWSGAHAAFKAETDARREELIKKNGAVHFSVSERALTLEESAQIDELFIRSDIVTLQQQLLERARTDGGLNINAQRVFLNPLDNRPGGVWNKRIKDVAQRVITENVGATITLDIQNEEFEIKTGVGDVRHLPVRNA